MAELAQVFEHGTLAVGEQGLTSNHFESLVRYNDQQGCTLFKVGHQRLHFGSYVGVMQVGALTIEVLPKAERSNAPDKRKWQGALLQMLRQSGMLDIKATPEANLRLRRSPLIDLYLGSFLTEVENLAHAGLVKKYRIQEGNLYKLKGRIIFRQQVSRNLLHRERMFTAHQTYDGDNVFNRILKCALKIVERIAKRPALTARAAALELSFERVSDGKITAETFDRLNLDRNTCRYRKALQLARLIILNYSPDLRGGRNNVLAILFDMNRLFERFILVQLLRAQGQAGERKLQIESQAAKPFWASRTVRPDIVITGRQDAAAPCFILDTKWKIPNCDQPSDEDLKQMYAYNHQFGAKRSLLLYPRAEPTQEEMNNDFAPSVSLPGHTHACGTHFIELFDDQKQLRADIGEQLLRLVRTEVIP